MAKGCDEEVAFRRTGRRGYEGFFSEQRLVGFSVGA